MIDFLEPGPDFVAIAKQLISDWIFHGETDEGYDENLTEGTLWFTVFDDWSVRLDDNPCTDGIVGCFEVTGSATDAKLLAEEIICAAAMLDYDSAEMTTPLKIGGR